jgi:hypothetical protein
LLRKGLSRLSVRGAALLLKGKEVIALGKKKGKGKGKKGY